jgi:hypothetical protein
LVLSLKPRTAVRAGRIFDAILVKYPPARVFLDPLLWFPPGKGGGGGTL